MQPWWSEEKGEEKVWCHRRWASSVNVVTVSHKRKTGKNHWL